jgi:hypothetical protein
MKVIYNAIVTTVKQLLIYESPTTVLAVCTL